MRTLASQSDIPFAADEAHRFLPWLVGIMASLAALLLCLGVTINSLVIDRHGSLTDNFTVSLPATEEGAAVLQKARELLQKQPGVEAITQLSETRIQELLKPWLGSGTMMEGLPLPQVLEVKLHNGNLHPDYDALQKNLTAVHPGIDVDAHERFVAAFSSFSAALQGVVALLAMIILGGLALMIAFTSRASLKLHGKTVQLLHSVGAEDDYITGQFQKDAFRIALYGAIPGCIVAGFAYWAAGLYVAALHAPMIPALNLTPPHIGLLAALPFACGIVALLSARVAVQAQLHRVL